MIKLFLVLSFLLGLMVFGIFFHYQTYSYEVQHKQFQNIVMLTHYSKPSLSLAYDKPQTLQDAKQNRTYPELSTVSTMEFTYVQ